MTKGKMTSWEKSWNRKGMSVRTPGILASLGTSLILLMEPVLRSYFRSGILHRRQFYSPGNVCRHLPTPCPPSPAHLSGSGRNTTSNYEWRPGKFLTLLHDSYKMPQYLGWDAASQVYCGWGMKMGPEGVRSLSRLLGNLSCYLGTLCSSEII